MAFNFHQKVKIILPLLIKQVRETTVPFQVRLGCVSMKIFVFRPQNEAACRWGIGEMAKRIRWYQVGTDLRNHPKLISSAKSLELPKVYVEGHLLHLWSSCTDYAEDGDLWKGDEESSLRFFESMADIPADPARFLDVFRKDR